ncbi:hypothetical protein [Aquibacillus kalidii]|uniref:hypothetical protein n=1 Tax=Aquibacillus kalidii TaxID=2762597 RepID=UPI001C99ED9E|nr:hypothetical protein [Aquibacillus kalidii]
MILLLGFFASYKYMTYTMKGPNDLFSTNLFVSSMINLAVHSLSIFGWFLYAWPRSEVQFINGLNLGVWLYISSELIFVALMLNKYRKEEVIGVTQAVIDAVKTRSVKIYEGMKSTIENQTVLRRKKKHNS